MDMERKQRIIIYGAGERFHYFFDDPSFYKNAIKDMGISIVALCDGSKAAGGQIVTIGDCSFEIREIDSVGQDSYDLVAVTSYQYLQEIRGQLMKKGIPSQKIVFFDEWVRSVLFDGEYPYTLSLVLIVRNEAAYLREWIEYHRLVGVEHFYIYDDYSTDNLKEVLSEYITQGIVTYHDWGMNGQANAYMHAVINYKKESKYMSFNDADEFLVPVCGDFLPDVIDGIVKECEERNPADTVHCGGIGINWRFYGTSGHKKKPSGLIIENYMYRAFGDIRGANFIKTAANPRTIERCDVHQMKYIKGYECISENGSSIPGPIFYDGQFQKIRINHYWSKSEEELYRKIARGSVTNLHRKPEESGKMTEELYRLYVERLARVNQYMNAVYDPAIARFIAPLRERLKQ